MTESLSEVNQLETGKIGKLLWQYALPSIVGTMVNSLYSVIDRIFIGHGVGPLAITGLTITLPVLILLQASGMLIGAGSAARISILLGKRDREGAEKILGNAFILTFLITGPAIILGMIFMKPMLMAFGGSEATVPYAEKFLKIMIPGNILAALSFGFNNMMRASGYPTKAMLTMIIGAISNVILAPIFIFGLGWGIEGAAIATVISMSISTVWVMSHFMSKHSYLRIRKKHLHLDKYIVWSIISIGLSPFFMQVAASFVNVVINTSMKKYGGDIVVGADGITRGDLAVGAFGICSGLSLLLIMFIVGLNQGMQPIVGYNYGARRYDRVTEALKKTIRAATIVAVAGSLCGFLMPEIIVKAFTNDKEMIRIASHGLRIMLSAFFVVGFQAVATNFFQCIGMAAKSIFLSLTRQCVLLIPCLIILPRMYDLDGVWLAQPVSDFLSAILTGAFLVYQLKIMMKKDEEVSGWRQNSEVCDK